MADDIPQWAKDRAVELSRSEWSYPGTRGIIRAEVFSNPSYPACIAFARYIAEHEEPPVDPLLIEAREIAAGFKHYEPEDVLAGQLDHSVALQMTLAALKRGMELANA